MGGGAYLIQHACLCHGSQHKGWRWCVVVVRWMGGFESGWVDQLLRTGKGGVRTCSYMPVY